jgi:ketosteroid isomerase-like protein
VIESLALGGRVLSKTNVELLRWAYDAFARGDIPSVLSVMTDEVQFVVAENSPYYRGTPYVGKQEIGEKLFARVGAEWDGYLIEVERLHDAGEIVVVQIRYRGTYKATGRTMAAQAVHIWTVRDGKLAKLEQYADTAGMRDVVGSPASVRTA